MNISVIAPALGEALEELKKYVARNEKSGRRTVIFCEDRLTLVAERAVCEAVGGTFSTAVYTFARFLSHEGGQEGRLLSSRGSAIVIRGITERCRDKLKLFRRLSAAAAAGSVYDTIALLYSSGISAEEVSAARAGGLLSDKLHDIAVIYSEYAAFLQESGMLDRNVYLRLLPSVIEASDKIKGADVVFLGFQAFTGTVSECVKACMRTAENTCGIFVGGAPDIYANEAPAQFEGFTRGLGGCKTVTLPSDLCEEAELIRQNLFDPRAFARRPFATDKIHIFQAADTDEELEFIAASIKKFVADGQERYYRISVMLADAEGARPALERIFLQYKIPYYLDERRALTEHGLTEFLCGFLECAAGGLLPEDVDGVLASDLFGSAQECENGKNSDALDDGSAKKERDIFRNYLARCAFYRGGIRREPRKDICEKLGFDYDVVSRVRRRFLSALSLLPQRAATSDKWAEGVKAVAEFFGCKERLEELTERYSADYPSRAEFNSRAYEGVLTVLQETAELGLGELYTAREYKKLLQSGLAAAEISLIPPKCDAVFVGDISATVNAGSDVVFAAGLTDSVPGAGADTALLTDREIDALCAVNINISPKIAQVNMRRRETVALNLCAFRKHLYLSYPLLSDGEEMVRSEIISYMSALFCDRSGKTSAPVTLPAIEASGRALSYYCSEPVPAMRMLAGGSLSPAVNSALYKVLKEGGFGAEAESLLKEHKTKQPINNGRELFAGGGNVSPTLLETYFSCPYKNYARQGLRLFERQEGALQPLDTGNFVHEVLKRFAELKDLTSETEARAAARLLAEQTLALPEFSSLAQGAGGEVTAQRLTGEAVAVCAGVFRQLSASNFRVRDVEKWCSVPVGDGLNAGGRIDRVDECGDLVRVIDYKTGNVSADAADYYAGVKIQLPLYLLAASEGKRPAGAYYFPANIEFRDKDRKDADFTLEGFMDSDEYVVSNSDTTVQTKERSRYVNAYRGGRQLSNNLKREDFADFIGYSALIARRGAEEMFSGNISPSPYGDECKYCPIGGMCGFAADDDKEGRSVKGVKCANIAEVTRKVKEGK